MSLGLRARRLIAYSIEWALVIFIATFAQFFLGRFQQIPNFDLTDTSIQNAVHAETIPDSLLVVILVLGFVLVTIGHFIFCRRDWWDLHSGLFGLMFGYGVCGTLSQIVRISVGRPRPDFIARCNPPLGSQNNNTFGLANIDICQSTDTAFLTDGMRSFFSGHAILSGFGMGFVSLYWAGKMCVLHEKRGFSHKMWLLAAPIVLSIWVCLTRVANRRHHWQDVATGFFLGLVITYTIYRQYFPPLGDSNSHVAYPPRYHELEGVRQSDNRDTARGEWVPLNDVERIPRRDERIESLGIKTTPLVLPHDRTASR